MKDDWNEWEISSDTEDDVILYKSEELELAKKEFKEVRHKLKF